MRIDYLIGTKNLPIPLTLCMVLAHRRTDRIMDVGEYATRCVRRDEVHELVLVARDRSTPGGKYGDVGYVGFVSFDCSGVIHVGQHVSLGGIELGRIVGFDGAHLPNHLNILVETNRVTSGDELGLSPGALGQIGEHADS